MAKFQICCYPWDGEYRPRAEAVLLRGTDALLVKMTAWEHTIVAAESRIGGAVYRDSCLEFFFQPCPDTDPRYLNIEVNALGVMHIGLGEGRGGRTVLRELPEGIRPSAGVLWGRKWSVRYDLPYAWIRSLFPGFAPGPGMRLRGNFYKCDESIHPHFGCWNPIAAPQPDFHRPDCFGEINLE